ncbi:MAG: GNAT family N-acetyltransferase [Candidatus Latescibacteria bacterium]|nr:GNAT family N-acetyltransferase [bacterium]MBD3423128.1 GNAT family N-acetyltransferase [Candidatus Latescibacterota bacterium]
MNSSMKEQENEELKIYELNSRDDIPEWTDFESMARFLHKSLIPFEDPLEEVKKGIDYALSSTGGKDGFIIFAARGDKPVGAVVMLQTNMSGYVPEFLLLFVAVRPDERGKGIGGRIIMEAVNRCEGDVNLHVEYDNPAKRLYERLGFVNKYADMRYFKGDQDE